MTNENVLKDIRCPECKSEGPFNITGATTFTNVSDDGCDSFEDMDWNDSSFIECISCGHTGTVREFTVTGKMKLRVYLAALTRMEHTVDIEVPDNTPEHEFDAIARRVYDETDAEDFTEDYEFWERGNCYCERLPDSDG